MNSSVKFSKVVSGAHHVGGYYVEGRAPGTMFGYVARSKRDARKWSAFDADGASLGLEIYDTRAAAADVVQVAGIKARDAARMAAISAAADKARAEVKPVVATGFNNVTNRMERTHADGTVTPVVQNTPGGLHGVSMAPVLHQCETGDPGCMHDSTGAMVKGPGAPSAPTGYVHCACRDCMETAIGVQGVVFCSDCTDAECALDHECQRPDAYGAGETEEATACVICGKTLAAAHTHVDTCGERCYRTLLARQRAAIAADETSSIVVPREPTAGMTARATDGAIETPSAELIEALRAEASTAGDLDQVAVCDRALSGDRDAMAECQRVINTAAAQSALETPCPHDAGTRGGICEICGVEL